MRATTAAHCRRAALRGLLSGGFGLALAAFGARRGLAATIPVTLPLPDGRGGSIVARHHLPYDSLDRARRLIPRFDGAYLKGRIRAAADEVVAEGKRRWAESLAARLEALATRLPGSVTLTPFIDGSTVRQRYRYDKRRSGDLVLAKRMVQQEIMSFEADTGARLQSDVDAEVRRRTRKVYAEHLYRAVRDGDAFVVQIDYGRVAAAQAGELTGLTESVRRLSGQTHPRALIADVLTAFQSLPYDRLETRDPRRREGFATPIEVLSIGRGDCDSKSTAMAALLATLLPRHSSVLITIPGHALLGVDLPGQPGDATVHHDGRVYVLMEPTGPGLLPIGALDDRSRRDLAAGRIKDVLPLSGPVALAALAG